MIKPANGMRYVKFLSQLHQQNLFDWYMEVGCRTGRTFAPVRGKTVAVDPFFRLDSNVVGVKPQLHVFQTTSDDFFETGFLAKNKIKLSFSFLDGMHLFEFLLRDIINTEANSDQNGAMALHDCCPFTHEMTTRNLDNLPQDAWTGDVWKIIPILQKYRPDLKMTVLDCKPTGLVVLSGLSPKNSFLKKNYDKIVEEFTDLTLKDFGEDKFFDSFEYTNARAALAEGLPFLRDVSQSPENVLTPEKITP